MSTFETYRNPNPKRGRMYLTVALPATLVIPAASCVTLTTRVIFRTVTPTFAKYSTVLVTILGPNCGNIFAPQGLVAVLLLLHSLLPAVNSPFIPSFVELKINAPAASNYPFKSSCPFCWKQEILHYPSTVLTEIMMEIYQRD